MRSGGRNPYESPWPGVLGGLGQLRLSAALTTLTQGKQLMLDWKLADKLRENIEKLGFRVSDSDKGAEISKI